MERTLYLTLFCMLLCIPVSASPKAEIYLAFISNDMAGWKHTISQMNAKRNGSESYLLELVNYQYGYIAWCIGNKKENEAKQWLQEAERNLTEIEKKTSNQSIVRAYKSAFCGFKIGLSNIKAPILGPKSIYYAESAMRLDPQNPFGYIQYANAYYYMPAIFGGSKKKALDYYLKAETLMRTHRQDWNYLSLLTNIANAYAETGNTKTAKVWYEKILKTEPDYLWVKNELYPKLINRIN